MFRTRQYPVSSAKKPLAGGILSLLLIGWETASKVERFVEGLVRPLHYAHTFNMLRKRQLFLLRFGAAKDVLTCNI